MRQVALDSAGGDEQGLSDLAIAEAVGGELCDASLAGRERVASAQREPPRTCAGRDELVSRAAGEP